MVGMVKPRKYAVGTANVDDDFSRGLSSISLNELQGLSNGGMPDPSSYLQSAYSTLNTPTPEFTPSRIDTREYAPNAPSFYEYGQAANSLSNPGSSAAREQASYESSQREQTLRDRLELQDRLQNDIRPNPARKAKGHTLLKKGTEKVPGKGDGTKDTVPAKLAPGEAVLNKAAAEHLGRGFIKLLNQYGMHKMGMVEPDEEDHYACGTEEIMKKGKK